MTGPQIKKHFYTWMVLFLLLFLGITAAYKASLSTQAKYIQK